MDTSQHLYSHHWISREVEVEGEMLSHQQCAACRRDFVWDGDAGRWRAVHIALLRFDFLDEETSRRWGSEECPGRQLPEDINDRRRGYRFS